MTEQSYSIHPIGTIRRTPQGIQVEVLPEYRPGLRQLEHFSHVLVFWWANRNQDGQSRTTLQTKPPYAEDKVTGVFACRSPYRPNPIALTTCRILSVDESSGVVRLENIDALDGTPVIDLKAYFPVCERVKDARIPEWLHDWPEWFPEEGLGL